MKINTSIGEFQVRFWHIQNDPIPGTDIELTLPDGTTRIEACSRLHPTDKFCKETGRKVALAKALEYSKLPKAVRQEVWEGYFNRGQTNN